MTTERFPAVSPLSTSAASQMPRARHLAAESRVAELLLRKPAAAEAMSMSTDSLERYVMPEIRVVRVGALVLVPVVELQRWVELHAARTIE